MSKEYLGDSVYAEIETPQIAGQNCSIKLTTENGNGPSNTIILEYPVFRALKEFAERHIERQE